MQFVRESEVQIIIFLIEVSIKLLFLIAYKVSGGMSRNRLKVPKVKR